MSGFDSFAFLFRRLNKKKSVVDVVVQRCTSTSMSHNPTFQYHGMIVADTIIAVFSNLFAGCVLACASSRPERHQKGH